MRIRAEFRKVACHKALEIRETIANVPDNEIVRSDQGLDEQPGKRARNSWVMMTPSVAIKSDSGANGSEGVNSA